MYDDLIKRLKYAADIASLTHPTWTALMTEAADAIEELSKENESLGNDLTSAVEMLKKKRKPKWIPVTERLPKGADKRRELCENVWLFLDDGNVYPGWMNGITEKVYYLGNYSDSLITAPISRVKMWQPRPEPPKEET